MTDTDHLPPALEEESTNVTTRILERLEAADIGASAACTATGCRPAALAGDSDLFFIEAVAIASLLGCSPADFFDGGVSDTPSDTLADIRS